MKYAQILNGVVHNVIILDDPTLSSQFLQGFDKLINIDLISPTPGVGWGYDANSDSFSEPSPADPVL